MTNVDLIRALREACERAPKGEKVLAIHLFAIANASHLEGHNVHEISERAGIGKFGPEIRKGMNLADHVILKCRDRQVRLFHCVT